MRISDWSSDVCSSDLEVSRDLLEQVVRAAVKDIGYEQDGFHWSNMAVENFIHAQSSDIAQGVDAAGNKDEGAGDQGIMFGFACRETETPLPAPLHFSPSTLPPLAEARQIGQAECWDRVVQY